jgi:hypothetical protein
LEEALTASGISLEARMRDEGCPHVWRYRGTCITKAMSLQEGSRGAGALGWHNVDDVVSKLSDREVGGLFEAPPQRRGKSRVGKSDPCH